MGSWYFLPVNHYFILLDSKSLLYRKHYLTKELKLNFVLVYLIDIKHYWKIATGMYRFIKAFGKTIQIVYNCNIIIFIKEIRYGKFIQCNNIFYFFYMVNIILIFYDI